MVILLVVAGISVVRVIALAVREVVDGSSTGCSTTFNVELAI